MGARRDGQGPQVVPAVSRSVRNSFGKGDHSEGVPTGTSAGRLVRRVSERHEPIAACKLAG